MSSLRKPRRTEPQRPRVKAVNPPPAPAHLGTAGSELWRRTVEDYELEGRHHEETLRLASEALDEAEQARAILKAEGLIVHDRFGQAVPHPAVKVEKDARAAYASLIRQLDLDGEPDPRYRR